MSTTTTGDVDTVAINTVGGLLDGFRATDEHFRTARRRGRGLPDGPGALGRTRYQRPAQLLPAPAPGDDADPVDLIGFGQGLNALRNHHGILSSNVFAQAQALDGNAVERFILP